MLHTVPSNGILLSLAEDETSGEEAWVNGSYDWFVPKWPFWKGQGWRYIPSRQYTLQFPITLGSAFVQKFPQKCPWQCVPVESRAFYQKQNKKKQQLDFKCLFQKIRTHSNCYESMERSHVVCTEQLRDSTTGSNMLIPASASRWHEMCSTTDIWAELFLYHS